MIGRGLFCGESPGAADSKGLGNPVRQAATLCREIFCMGHAAGALRKKLRMRSRQGRPAEQRGAHGPYRQAMPHLPGRSILLL